MRTTSKKPSTKKPIIFILGGARSGKSSFALKEASGIRGKKAFIATAEALDDEMKERIERHRKQRGEDWDTFEEPMNISHVLKKIGDDYSVAVIDCLTLWLSNIMLAGRDVEKEIGLLVSSFSTVRCSIFTVSNEVGMGIVPDNEPARKFRDLAGILNKEVAALADAVYLVTAGIPLRIK